MKKFIFLIMAIVLSLMSANAQTVSIADVTLHSGETKVVSINLENTQSNIVSFQMDLTLPDGITINKADCKLGNRITDEAQELFIGKQPDGNIRLTSTSLTLTPIEGTSGEIIKLSLTAANNAKGGTASLSNIKLATDDSQRLTPENSSFQIGVTYTLTYKVDGEIYKTDSIVYNSALTPISVPTKEGYTFSGWSEIPETMPAHDVVITGTFTINNYKLIYMVDGVEYKSYDVEYGATITPEPAPAEKEGYTFSGWSEIPGTMPAHDVTITGSFNVNKYKLTYIVDGVEYKSYDIEYGATITPETAPTKEGYTFSGWSEIPETMPAHDVTVTGTFGINTYKLTYMIDDAVYKVVDYKYGETITPEPAPEGNYASFEWVGLPETMPAKDVTVYANYVTGITDVVIKENIVRIYSPNGKILDKLQKGLNIVLMKDGTIKKIVVK